MKYTYSPNMMGPASIKWYENNNIPYTIVKYVNKFIDPTGKEVERKDYTEYAGGRIDIHCDVCQWQEIACPIMIGTDWNLLHDFCDEFESDTQLNEVQFFDEFERWLGRPVNFAPNERKFIYE